jgi:phosphatidylglycerophosphate synthase
MTASRRNLIRWGALALGVVLFFGTLYYINFRTAVGTIQRLGVALPLALFFSGLWHLARTWAWAWCFPQPRTVSFARLARVRLAAEAFSYLTLRGIAGEPLKVVLLADRMDARQATAAVALERVAYMVGTMVIVGIGSLLAMAGLPLTRIWFRIFRAFAIVAAITSALTIIVISGRGTYLQSFIARLDRALGTSLSGGRVARFVAAVERQMLELVRGNPRRLVVLMTATILSYVFMALEAWVILRGSGLAISANGALAVETFSRVASFASAFIPANLGALEASSLAAVAAIGAASGGAALALARRLRGLFWAGIGLAIYPRGARSAPAPADNVPVEPPKTPSALLYLPNEPGVLVSPHRRLAGLPIAERVLRSAFRAGYDRVIVWAPQAEGPQGRLRGLARTISSNIAIVTTADDWRRAVASLACDSVTVVGAGTVVSPALLRAARSNAPTPGESRQVAAGPDFPESGVLRLTTGDAMDPASLTAALGVVRARALPLPSGEDVSIGRAMLAIRMVAEADMETAERTIRRSSYKDTDATIARFNRRMSLPISIALIRTPLTANQLSITLVAIGFYSGWLFSIGQYWTGVLAAFLSLAASVLDGCDGEIARLKYQESALGCWIETVGDYSYYIAIFVGLAIGAARKTGSDSYYWIGGVAIAGTLLSFALLIYLRSRITGGQPERMHAIARERFLAEPTPLARLIVNLSFVVTRAAMPYGIMAFALFNALPAIVVLAAIVANIYWVIVLVKLRDLLGDTGEQSLAS